MSESPTQHGPIVLDLDDFIADVTGLRKVHSLQQEFGEEFRITLFTVPGRSTLSTLRGVYNLMPWVALVPHGSVHSTPYECANWDADRMREYLDMVEVYGMQRGFKAPGWNITQGIYEALVERDHWVADHATNRPRRPAALRTYELDEPRKIHGHLGHLGGYNANEVDLILPAIRAAVQSLEKKREAGLYSGPLFGWCADEVRRTGEA